MATTEDIQNEDIYEYSEDRYEYIVDFLNRHFEADANIVEIGCGSGNILKYIDEKTKIKNLYGIDISEKALAIARKRGINTYLGSITDRRFVSNIEVKFDLVILGAILHHLVGRNRKTSYFESYRALKNSILLLKDNGYICILEPIFEPSFVGDLIFYIKKSVGKLTSKRVPVFGYWNNIGPPVVSYFTKDTLLKIVKDLNNFEIIDIYEKELKRSFLMKLFFIKKRSDLTLILRKKIGSSKFTL